MSFELTDKIGREAVNLKNLIDDYKSRGYVVCKWNCDLGVDYKASNRNISEVTTWRPISPPSGSPRYGYNFANYNVLGSFSIFHIKEWKVGKPAMAAYNWDVRIELNDALLYNRLGSNAPGQTWTTSFPPIVMRGFGIFLPQIKIKTPMYGQRTDGNFKLNMIHEVINFMPKDGYVNDNGDGNDRFSSPDGQGNPYMKEYKVEKTFL